MATKLTKTQGSNLRERLEERFEQDKENFKANTRTLISIGISRDRLHKMLDEVLAGEGGAAAAGK